MSEKESAKKAVGAAAEKGKGFLKEFKAFALKGNVMDLAVGVIIGAAFQNIVTALTNSFINPLIALCTGGIKKDPETGAIEIIGGQFTIGGVSFDYGAFISAVINFLIMAFILFLLIKGVNRIMTLGQKKEESKPAEPPKPSNEELLLTEIRDLLKAQVDAEVAETEE